MRRFLLLSCALVVLAGCSSSSRPSAPTVAPARTFSLSGFGPARVARPGPATLAFTIRQPSGEPLTSYRRGPGPHTGIHLIVVRRDLGVIIHRHPPISADGRVSETIDFPKAGPYRVLVDAYPSGNGLPRNFQLHEDVRVGGRYRPRPLPPFAATQTVDGYRIDLRAPRTVRAIEAATLVASVRDPSGKPVVFKPWFGALAHAIFFRAGSLDYFHSHICGNDPACSAGFGTPATTGHSTKPGRMELGVLLPASGTWRLFLQVFHKGKLITAPFTLRVQ